MLKKMLVVLLCCSVSVALPAVDVELRADHPERHVVRKGDTLWDIAAMFLTKPWLWPEIWQVNPQIKNPHLIYPGDGLSLAFKDGKPYLQVTRGQRLKLSPKVRSAQRARAIPPIPLDAIQPFLSRPRVVGPDELQRAPYVLSSRDQHLVAGAGHRIYIRGLDDAGRTRYTVYRQGEVYRDPVDNEVLGYEALHVGDAVVERFGDPATAVITRSKREVLIGDRLLPESHSSVLEFVPRAPDHELEGSVIAVIDGVSQVGQYQVVVLNLGEEQGLVPGHVLALYQSGEFVRDNIGAAHAGELVELPEERIGDLMVFRTFGKVSYALVMRTERPAHVYDAVRNP